MSERGFEIDSDEYKRQLAEYEQECSEPHPTYDDGSASLVDYFEWEAERSREEFKLVRDIRRGAV